ncbi:FAD/NAD(P)-binding protein [Streptomyces sp. NPDC049585]|uniref:FAD/NAD(P)-binding protein n=1 Tax=Streptomyces sp. NPDC049585 TaxID=3155154 RepID=UPI0034285FE8
MPAHPLRPAAAPRLALVGMGPRGTGLLERIAANAPGLLRGSPLDLHLVDPYPPGGGRVWRREQSPLLWMNSHAEDVTLYTDESVACAGPVRPGPSLAEWAALVRDGGPGAETIRLDPDTAAAVRALHPRDFAGRRLQNAYLSWVYERAVAALPPGVTVHRHHRRAVRLDRAPDGRQRLWLDGADAPLLADAVVLCLGHLDAAPDPAQQDLARFAAAHDLTYLPPQFTADSDLRALRPGEPVLVRGIGLAFTDLMVLLSEGRGGRFTPDGPGRLAYHPSGREPVLYAGSRRGVPYRAKIGYPWDGEPLTPPRFLGPAQAEQLRRLPRDPDLHHDLLPLVAKDLGYAHYHRLFTAHPERTRTAWTDFAETYAASPPGSAELDALVAASVPDPADRLDLAALDRPLRLRTFPGTAALQEAVRTHIEADIARRDDPRHSADFAVFLALLSVYAQLGNAGGPAWHGFFSYLASGPPAPRLRQLVALSRAGIVRFLGADAVFTTDREAGTFRAHAASVPGHVVRARALVEARLPEPTVERSRDPLLRGLAAKATGRGLLAVDPADGRVRAGLYALGPFTDAGGTGAAFARPRTNAVAFRQNDATARAVLRLVGGGVVPRPRPFPVSEESAASSHPRPGAAPRTPDRASPGVLKRRTG